MKIGDEVLVHGYIDEIRKDCIIIRNEGGYFGTVEAEVHGMAKENQNITTREFCIELEKLLAVWNPKADTPQTDIHGLTDCDFCKEKNCEDCEGGNDEPQTD